ncbi:hypothetical protein [Lysobacter enzymogenes]|uniref:Uncharacterized protein n=1 Tax=Lysobacter enzymogenes TaxID=69 RepID=A0A3N2RIU3_LYSEN|nr:hypothetical protein [Lysobacter enzymogenes]ROU07392.1 hypothetical protein D9T17_08760 [Lysobacter enzymogenes]
MAHLAPPLAPPRIGLSLRAVVAEYLRHGRLVSSAAFGLDPRCDLDAALAQGWQRSTLHASATEQLERDFRLRHRGGWRPLTLKPFYLRGRCLGASLDLWRGLPLAQALPWLRGPRPAPTLEWFHFVGADQGAVLVDGRTGLHFRRRGRRFMLTAVDASIAVAADDPDLPGGFDNGRWLRSLMTPCADPAHWRALAAQEADPRAALQAIREIAPFLPAR